VGCDQLPESFHGKEGVDGSSPSEGFSFLPAQPRFSAAAAFADRVVCSVMESVWKAAEREAS
jgi:hypothetical protein